MSVALTGNLRDFGMGEVFQLIGQQRKTGVLAAEGPDSRVEVWFDEGNVVSATFSGPHPEAALGDMLVRVGMLSPELLSRVERARSGSSETFERLLVRLAEIPMTSIDEVKELVTHEVIFTLLRWSQGSFDFRARPVSHTRRPHQLLPAEQILMDGLRMVDEWRSFPPEVTHEGNVFTHAGSFDLYREAFPGESGDWAAAAERLFELIDGHRNVRHVIDLSRLGTFEGTRILAGLRTCGAIESVDPEIAARGPRFTDELTRAGALRPILAALPFAVLFALLFLLEAPRPGPLPAGSIAAEVDPWTDLAARYETLRQRRLVQMEAFRTGDSAVTPERADSAALRSAALLAGPQAAPYYFERDDGNTVVLAPER